MFINSKEPPGFTEELEELTRDLKAVSMPAAGLFGFPSHAVITGPRSVHVNAYDEVAERRNREEGQEEPKPWRHVFNGFLV